MTTAIVRGLMSGSITRSRPPVGLSSCWLGYEAGHRRDADALARRFVAGRSSSVFNVPPLEALECSTYEDAVALCRERGRFAPSRQGYGLRTKMLQVAEHAYDDRVYEVHPEVSFAAIGGRPLAYGKSWNGLRERIALLEGEGLDVSNLLEFEKAADDVLDAAVSAWSVDCIARGQASRLPAGSTERFPAIWY